MFRNDGRITHEATIGDAGEQHDHEQAMAAGSATGHAHGLAAVEVEPGRTATVVYRFDQPGPVLIGCHEPGHYDAGMLATVTVTA